jgi:hypothetical protein
MQFFRVSRSTAQYNLPGNYCEELLAMKIFSSKIQLCIFVLGIQPLLLGQTVVNGGRVQIGSWDASGAARTLPSKRGTIAQLPATCTQGEEYFATDAAAGLNKYYCTAPNTWTQGQGMSAFTQSGAGAVSRTVTDKLRDIIHVKDFGAKGDGVTDDSAAFTAALASGASEVRADGGTYVINSTITLAKGQKIYFGVGTHTIAGIRFTDSLSDQSGTGKIECAGSGQTTLKLKNGANQDVISQTNFASLTGKNSKYGLFRGEIRGCTIDGNKTGQTAASYGVRLYGHGLRMMDVTVRYAYSDGIYTEWGLDSTFATAFDDLEGFFSDIRSHFNNGNGWTFRGPHDSDFLNVVLYQNGGWGLQVQTLANTYNGNGHFSNINTFLNVTGGIYSNSSFDGSQIAATTNSGWGMWIASGAGSHNLTSSQFSGPVGLEVDSPSQIISGSVVNSTTSALRLNGGSGNFTLQMFNNTGYQVDFTSEMGPSIILVNSANPPAGPLMNGTPAQNDFVYLDFGGPSTNRYMAVPVNTLHVAGWSPQFPQSNSIMAVVNDASQVGNLHATNLSLSSSAQVGGSTFAALGSAADGTILYCSDCTQTTACAAGGTGAIATHINGAWSCGGGVAYSFRDNLVNTSGTVDFNPFDSTVLSLSDEFMPNRVASGLIGQLGWSISGLGGGMTYVALDPSPSNHPGTVRITGDNLAAGHGVSMTLSDSYDGGPVNDLANLGSGGAFSSWEMQTSVLTDSSVSSGKYFIGLSDTQGAYHPANGNSIAVRFDSAGGGCSSNESTSHWIYEVIVSGAKYCVDSTVTVAPNTWYKVRIYSTTPGTVQFQIGIAGGALGNSGIISQAPTVNLTPQFAAISTTTAYQNLTIDWWAMKMRGLIR